MLVFVAARLVRVGGPGASPLAGGAVIGPGTPSELTVYRTGYDGQFVYRLALDPFTRVRTAHGITFGQANDVEGGAECGCCKGTPEVG